MTLDTESGWIPRTEQERADVLAQLERILADSHFRNSRRYPHFLRHVVEETIHGAGDQLKERNLGIVIFDRPADYDTNSDSIVRVTAGEIRRRLAQYYDQAGHAGELRIELPAGSYTPQFILGHGVRLEKPMAPAVPVAEHAAGDQRQVPMPASRSALPRAALLLMLVAVSAGIGAYVSWAVWGQRGNPTLNQFWRFDGVTQKSISICIGQVEVAQGTLGVHPEGSVRGVTSKERLVVPSDAGAATSIASAATTAGLSPSLIGSFTATFLDMQREPSVLIGAFDNQWTLRLSENLPYRLVHENSGETYQIVDTRASTPRVYQLDMTTPYTQFTQDYGVVGRFVSPVTNQPTVVVAGLAANGTAAATRLVTSEPLLEQVIKSLPADWRKKNLEILVATQVIDGKDGPPKVLGFQSW